MKMRFLFPHKFKIYGWITLVIGLLLGILLQLNNVEPSGDFSTTKVFALYNDGFLTEKDTGFFKIIENDISDEIITLLIIIGGVLIGFSRLKVEDEFSFKLRSESLIWAFYVSSALTILVTILIFGGIYFNFLLYNLFLQLLFFIARFHYVLYKSQKELSYEE
ncbi:hypothetical protein [Pustulibacterium marinum]|nr:hypothetical protein [Pustulibacterium marinum]